MDGATTQRKIAGSLWAMFTLGVFSLLIYAPAAKCNDHDALVKEMETIDILHDDRTLWVGSLILLR